MTYNNTEWYSYRDFGENDPEDEKYETQLREEIIESKIDELKEERSKE